MSRLSDLINEGVGDARKESVAFDVHEVAKAIRPRLEDEHRETLIDEALTARIKAASTKTRKSVLEAAVETQAELFFGLPPMVAIDDKIKNTHDLTRLDVERVIKVRRDGIADDLKSVERWEAARDATKALMAKNPGWTFGDALHAAMQAMQSAA